MKKWYFQLKSEKRSRIPPIEKAKKLQLKNNLKKHLKYVKLLMLRRFSLSYPKKYKNVAGIPNFKRNIKLPFLNPEYLDKNLLSLFFLII